MRFLGDIVFALFWLTFLEDKLTVGAWLFIGGGSISGDVCWFGLLKNRVWLV